MRELPAVPFQTIIFGVLAIFAYGYLSVAPGFAADFARGDLKISQPWARATPGGAKVAGAYVTITNSGKVADRLVGGSTAIAGVLEVHDMTMTDGVMRMRHLDKGIEIKPGETITLKPGSTHLMFMELKQPLKQGDKIKGALVFEKAGTVDIEYEVAPIGAASLDGTPAKAPDHKHH